MENKTENTITLYHGATEKFELGNIHNPSKPMDFGKGFYLTTSLQQAKDQAKKKSIRENFGTSGNNVKYYVYSYKVNLDDLLNLHLKTGRHKPVLMGELSTSTKNVVIDKKWLDVITTFRCNKLWRNEIVKYDIIYGAVADGSEHGKKPGEVIMDALKEYELSEKTEPDVKKCIKKLQPHLFVNQIVFKTDESIKLLQFDMCKEFRGTFSKKEFSVTYSEEENDLYSISLGRVTVWITPIIAKLYNISEKDAMYKFMESKTYNLLTRKELGFLNESLLLFIYMFESEQKNGDPMQYESIDSSNYEFEVIECGHWVYFLAHAIETYAADIGKLGSEVLEEWKNLSTPDGTPWVDFYVKLVPYLTHDGDCPYEFIKDMMKSGKLSNTSKK